jgi:predicted GNAT family N-acyltransferase
VHKLGGVDDGALYATKVVEKNCLYWGMDGADLMIERRVLEMNGESEFLVGLHYAFQTRETVHLITGEYVKSYMYGCRILPDWRKCSVLLINLCRTGI